MSVANEQDTVDLQSRRSDRTRSLLSEQQAQILRFEQRCEVAQIAPGVIKDDVIVETFQMAPVAYYRVLDELLDDPAAMAAEPMLVGRLRRVRDARSAAWRA